MRCFWSGLALASILAAGSASADPAVYHSPNDSGWRPAPGYVHVPAGSPVTLYLWLDSGPTTPPLSGTVCVNATGNASCAYDVRLEASGGPQFQTFTPTVGSCGVGCNLTSTMLRVNRVLPLGQHLIGRQKIGTLTMNSGPAGGKIEVTGVHSVGAARQLLPIDGLPPPPTPTEPDPPGLQIVAVPEPDMLILLFSGLAGLALLHRLRGSR